MVASNKMNITQSEAQPYIKQMPKGECTYCDLEYDKPTGFFPPHTASPRCQSGHHNHCTCDTCFQEFMKNKLIHYIRLYKINRLSYHGIFLSIYLTLRGGSNHFGEYLWEKMNAYIELDLEPEFWDLMKESK